MIHTNSPWVAVPNKSWGEEHKKVFGDVSGFVICHGRGLIPLASVFGTFKSDVKTIEANAKLIASAPDMLKLLKTLQNDLANSNFTELSAFQESIDELIKKATL